MLTLKRGSDVEDRKGALSVVVEGMTLKGLAFVLFYRVGCRGGQMRKNGRKRGWNSRDAVRSTISPLGSPDPLLVAALQAATIPTTSLPLPTTRAEGAGAGMAVGGAGGVEERGGEEAEALSRRHRCPLSVSANEPSLNQTWT